MSARTLLIVVIVVAVAAIASALLGARRIPSHPGDPVAQQQDVELHGTGSSLGSVSSLVAWARPAFPLDQLTIDKAAVTQRLITLKARVAVAIAVTGTTGTTVRQLTLALHQPPATASSALVVITYQAIGTLPAGVSADHLPPASAIATSPALPRRDKQGKLVMPLDWTCALPIYPGGAVVVLHSLAAGALTCEIR